MEQPIRMVDLIGQYDRIREEVQQALHDCMETATFIQGPQVQSFTHHLSQFLDGAEVIPVANGTDALQIALMALGLQPGDEVIVPAFTYVASAEVIGLLGLTPVLVDVDPDTFNCTAAHIEAAITPRTKAFIPVHLFGQACDLEAMEALSRQTGIPIVEDNAQSLGAAVRYQDGSRHMAGTVGSFGCTSFFPSKNLGAFGDGGTIMTRNPELAAVARMIANHGQSRRYYHDRIGVNSRLDSMQAAVLDIKLRHLSDYHAARLRAAQAYDEAFADLSGLICPARAAHSDHVFHQYTLRVLDGRREALQQHLQQLGIPSMIYYPVPLQEQLAFKDICQVPGELPNTAMLCREVLSLPMHTELSGDILGRIIEGVRSFFV